MAEEAGRPALRVDQQQFAQEVAQEIAADLNRIREQKGQAQSAQTLLPGTTSGSQQ